MCIDSSLAPDPLYYLGETTRRWNPFRETLRDGRRTPRHRGIRDTVPPALGKPRTSGRGMFYGHWEQTLRIPVIEKYSGIPGRNAVSAFDKNGNWIADEYDPRQKGSCSRRSRLPATQARRSPYKLKTVRETQAGIQVTVPDGSKAEYKGLRHAAKIAARQSKPGCYLSAALSHRQIAVENTFAAGGAETHDFLDSVPVRPEIHRMQASLGTPTERGGMCAQK